MTHNAGTKHTQATPDCVTDALVLCICESQELRKWHKCTSTKVAWSTLKCFACCISNADVGMEMNARPCKLIRRQKLQHVWQLHSTDQLQKIDFRLGCLKP